MKENSRPKPSPRHPVELVRGDHDAAHWFGVDYEDNRFCDDDYLSRRTYDSTLIDANPVLSRDSSIIRNPPIDGVDRLKEPWTS